MDIGRSWTQRRADGMIALISMAWGSSYLMMKVGLDGRGPFCLTALRFSLAFAAVALLFLPQLRRTTWRTLGHAAALGLLLFGVFAFLLHGMETTTASNAGFLTSTTVVLVPLLNALLRRRPPEGPIALGAVLALGGIGLLSFQSGTGFHSGDLLCLGGALCYACHILLTDRLTRRDDALLLGVWQLGFTALYGALALLLFEPPTHPTSPTQWAAVLGLALVCSAFGFVVQPLAQAHTTPEHTGLLFALEPVFAALFARLFLHEALSAQGLLGAGLVLAGVLVASWPRHGAAAHATQT